MRVTVQSRSYVPAFIVEKGDILRIEDIAGQQAADVIIASADNHDWMSCIYTQLLNRTSRITAGHVLYSKRARRLATVVADTAGTHWFGGGFCSAETNIFRYGIDGGSCRENLAHSLRDHIGDAFELELDSCASLFMNITIDSDGSLAIAAPPSKPGDYFEILAETRLLVAVSACPQERNPCNGFNPTPVGLSTRIGNPSIG